MERSPADTPSDPSAQSSRSGELPQRLAQSLSRFEARERERLGLPQRETAQWLEPVHDKFSSTERGKTTIVIFGLTKNHDTLMSAAVRYLGHRVLPLEVPDNESHTVGRAYCDRGMCNPTYFTVGHLLRFLRKLRDEEGLSVQEIIDRYVLVTPNGCGPCRFSLYINEFRKALRDAGFEGFRVLLFNQRLIERQTGPDAGLQIDGRLMFHLVRGIIVADVLNLLLWRTRPYELEPGATEAAMARCRERLIVALENNRGLVKALWAVRRELASVTVDRTRPRPKVGIIGEIWAQTTEGEGNYRLQHFLEAEGAEVEPQTLIAWILLLQWELVHDSAYRAGLQEARLPLQTVSPLDAWGKIVVIYLLVGVIRGTLRLFSWLAGLRGFKVSWMGHLARKAHAYYDMDMRGGEMFSEVAKLIDYAEKGSAHLVVSVKPFGCMPSSAVSDGVQSLVSERYPNVGFLPVETTGDSAVNVYSRLQMQLFRARSLAEQEAEAELMRRGARIEDVRAYLARQPKLGGTLSYHVRPHACTAANLFHRLGRSPRFLVWLQWRKLMAWMRGMGRDGELRTRRNA